MNSAAAQITMGRSLRVQRAGRATGAPHALRAARLHRLRVRSAAEEPATAAPAEEAAAATSNGAATAQHNEPAAGAEAASTASTTVTLEALPEQELEWVEPSGSDRTWTSWKLLWALPWRRFKSGSVLTLKLSGAISEQPQGRFSQTQSLPALCECLRKAAVDPRIKGLVVKVDPLAAGWGKLQELRRHIEFFRQSGKFAIAYLERAGEKEYYLASAFSEIYAPPSASLSLRGMSVAGTFLRGALEKVGVEPEVRRIGKYKSAGDQLLREDMSEAQREQLNALLDDMYETWVADVSASLGKTREEVEAVLDEGVYDMKVYKERGFVTDLVYECELEEMLKKRTETEEGKELRKVGYKKYSRVSPTAFGLSGGRKAIAVVRTAGAITGTSSGGAGGSSITSPAVIGQLRALKKDKNIAAVVLRIDSPGGDALASDLMWREIRELGKTKPIIASMADVAASGGYYMAMGCSKIVAERSTITGSIGVVTGKFNLAGLYEKLGYNKEVLSRGRYAQLFAENKPFSAEEEVLFDAAAQHAYESFRDKAAESRGMTKEAMQEVAQGRVWSGRRASGLGLVDAVGGLNRALQLAKQAAGLTLDERVRLLEVSRAKTSPLALLSGGGASLPAALGQLVLQSLAGGSAAQGVAATQVAAGAPLLLQALAAVAGGAGSSGMPSGTGGLAAGQVLAQMPDLVVEGVASQALMAAGPAGGSADSGSGGLFDEE